MERIDTLTAFAGGIDLVGGIANRRQEYESTRNTFLSNVRCVGRSNQVEAFKVTRVSLCSTDVSSSHEGTQTLVCFVESRPDFDMYGSPGGTDLRFDLARYELWGLKNKGTRNRWYLSCCVVRNRDAGS